MEFQSILPPNSSNLNVSRCLAGVCMLSIYRHKDRYGSRHGHSATLDIAKTHAAVEYT